MIRIFLVGLAAVLGVSSPVRAQVPGPSVPVILREHAEGGEIPVLVTGLSFLGMAVTDIVTAPASARWYNEQNPSSPPRSPRGAFRVSFASTAIPVLVGTGMIMGAQTDAFQGTGGALIYGGVLVGPSMGHWYAGRPRRALTTLGVRAGLSVLAGMLSSCCT